MSIDNLQTGGGLIDSGEIAARGQRELEEAAAIAERFDLEFVEMEDFRIDNDLFRSIPLDLMMRYEFIPERQLEGRVAIVMADPKDVTKLDELELLLDQPVEVRVGARSAIEEILKRSESAQRVLDDATEGFRIQLVQEDGDDEVLSLDRITSDSSPIIKLVDSTILNAIATSGLFLSDSILTSLPSSLGSFPVCSISVGAGR